MRPRLGAWWLFGRVLTRSWQTFVAWLHPNAGWTTAVGDVVTREELLAMLDSGGVGSEPRLRIRGDGVRMTTALADELDAASGGGGAGASFVAEDYTEIEWVRTYAAMAADSAVSVEVVSYASGPVATGQEEPVTVRLTIVKAVADVEHVVRLWLLYSSLSDCMHVHA